jgi:imidazolonepropionase-like amidohydrolase
MRKNYLALIGNIIDGTGKDPIERGMVIVENGRITTIGKRDNISLPKDVNVIEGNILMPGMIDAHVHLCVNGEPDTIKVFLDSTLSTYAIKATVYVKKSLEAGFTTLRSVGEPGYLGISIRNAINQGIIPGSRVLTSGPLLSATGGHGTFLPPWLSSEINMSIFADGVEELRKVVRKLIGTGVDLIKICVTGGVMDIATEPSAQNYNLDEIKAATFEAHKLGRKVAAHVEGLSGAKDSIRGGVDTIEHGVELDEETIQMMKEKGTFLVPTLVAVYNACEYGVKGGMQEYAIRKNEKLKEKLFASFKLAYHSGAKIAMGSDTGTAFNQHGNNAKELELYVENGMSPMEAIVCATKTASEAIGIQENIGTLEQGKTADILVLDKNPLEDIKILQNKQMIKAVIKEGIVFFEK